MQSIRLRGSLINKHNSEKFLFARELSNAKAHLITELGQICQNFMIIMKPEQCTIHSILLAFCPASFLPALGN